MNLINLLPELLERILMNLSCIEIFDLCSKILEIGIFCKKHNIIEKRKFLGFPRSNGHCEVYDVSNFNVKNLNFIFDLHDDDDQENIKILRDPPKMFEILEYLKDELVYGDLVCYKGINISKSKQWMCIFNGIQLKFLDFDAMDGYGTLPQKFSVITTDTPIKYWDQEFNYEFEQVITKGLPNNSCIWLNISKIKDQLLNNIIETVEEDQKFTTTFQYNNMSYTLYCYFGESGEGNVENIKDVFLEREVVLLSRDDFGELLERDVLENELFFDVDYCCYY